MFKPVRRPICKYRVKPLRRLMRKNISVPFRFGEAETAATGWAAHTNFMVEPINFMVEPINFRVEPINFRVEPINLCLAF